MSSVVNICNRALSRVGDKRIIALTDDSNPARACNDAWERVRDEVFREHAWNSICTRASLAALSSTPAFGYDDEYQLPVDCLRVLEVYDTKLPWVVEGRKILCDAGTPLPIRYMRKATDSNEYDPLLTSVLAQRLAVEICEELTQSNSKKEFEVLRYETLLTQAKAADAQEQSPVEFEEDDWLDARW